MCCRILHLFSLSHACATINFSGYCPNSLPDKLVIPICPLSAYYKPGVIFSVVPWELYKRRHVLRIHSIGCVRRTFRAPGGSRCRTCCFRDGNIEPGRGWVMCPSWDVGTLSYGFNSSPRHSSLQHLESASAEEVRHRSPAWRFGSTGHTCAVSVFAEDQRCTA